MNKIVLLFSLLAISCATLEDDRLSGYWEFDNAKTMESSNLDEIDPQQVRLLESNAIYAVFNFDTRFYSVKVSEEGAFSGAIKYRVTSSDVDRVTIKNIYGVEITFHFEGTVLLTKTGVTT